VSKLERELRKSAAKTEFHRDIMRGLISEHVADTYRRLPIHVSDEEWEEIGLEPSGTRAKLLSKAGEEWRSNHCLKDRAELLEWIKAMHLECAD
jgi:hypothetical protein